MRIKSTLSIFLFTTVFFLSCTKSNTSNINTGEQETTFELSTGLAVADNFAEDANGILMEAAAKKNLLGDNSIPVVATNNLAGVNITVSPANSFPKSIIIDFGTGTTSSNGIERKGRILIKLSDMVRKNGSTAIILFDNYFVNGYKKEGTITWTNTNTATAKGWQRKTTNGKTTAPDGEYWLFEGVRDAVQIAGAATPNTLLDDIFLITGNQTVTNALGKTRNCFITEALEKKLACENITAGKLRVEASNHTAVIDFGSGTCDNLATISIDGKAPRTIVLR